MQLESEFTRSVAHRKVGGDLRAPLGRVRGKTRPEVAFHLKPTA